MATHNLSVFARTLTPGGSVTNRIVQVTYRRPIPTPPISPTDRLAFNGNSLGTLPGWTTPTLELPQLPGSIVPTSDPSVTSWTGLNTDNLQGNGGRLDIVVRGSDNFIYHNFATTGTNWGAWQKLNWPTNLNYTPQIVSAPSISAFGAQNLILVVRIRRLNVFPPPPDRIFTNVFTPGTNGTPVWRGWNALPTPPINDFPNPPGMSDAPDAEIVLPTNSGLMLSGPSVVGVNPNGFTIYMRGADNRIYGWSVRNKTGQALQNWTLVPEYVSAGAISTSSDPEVAPYWNVPVDPFPNPPPPTPITGYFAYFYRLNVPGDPNDRNMGFHYTEYDQKAYPANQGTAFEGYPRRTDDGFLKSGVGSALYRGRTIRAFGIGTNPATSSQEYHAFVRGADDLCYGIWAGFQQESIAGFLPMSNWYSMGAFYPKIAGKPDAATWIG